MDKAKIEVALNVAIAEFESNKEQASATCKDLFDIKINLLKEAKKELKK
jgi:hypothetical protein